jgi:pimeloyl-ACP methyl ester carboxylesterase
MIATPPHLGSSIMRETQVLARITELTSRVYTYVRFDPHGCGLSDRRDDDLSVESFVRDLEALAEAAAPEPFILFATGMMTAPAMVYAARYPERLTHLLLWMVMVQGSDYETPATQQIKNLALTDWKLATESGMRAVDNWEHEEVASEMAALMRDSVTPETYVKFEDARAQWDVREILHDIQTPTLIIHPRNQPYYPPSIAQQAAAEIPGARLALIDSATVLFPDASISFVAAEFLGTLRARRERPAQDPSGMTAILFTDIADSTALTERLGDARFREMARSLDIGLRGAIRECGGVTVEAKTLGDGVLATFGSAAQAIEGARRCLALSAASELGLHIGLHRVFHDGRRRPAGDQPAAWLEPHPARAGASEHAPLVRADGRAANDCAVRLSRKRTLAAKHRKRAARGARVGHRSGENRYWTRASGPHAQRRLWGVGRSVSG